MVGKLKSSLLWLYTLFIDTLINGDYWLYKMYRSTAELLRGQHGCVQLFIDDLQSSMSFMLLIFLHMYSYIARSYRYACYSTIQLMQQFRQLSLYNYSICTMSTKLLYMGAQWETTNWPWYVNHMRYTIKAMIFKLKHHMYS